MVDEMINTVRAAFAPGADAATKQQAAAILRGLLGMLESGSGGASTLASRLTAGSAPVAPPAAPMATDLLTAIVELVRPHLPAEALAQMPRFRVPLIDFVRGDKR